jgi:hypothetical protein
MKPRPKEWTNEEKLALRKLARQGHGVKEISKRLRRYARSVKRVADEMKIRLPIHRSS